MRPNRTVFRKALWNSALEKTKLNSQPYVLSRERTNYKEAQYLTADKFLQEAKYQTADVIKGNTRHKAD